VVVVDKTRLVHDGIYSLDAGAIQDVSPAALRLLYNMFMTITDLINYYLVVHVLHMLTVTLAVYFYIFKRYTCILDVTLDPTTRGLLSKL
jgi:hypothetical protein